MLVERTDVFAACQGLAMTIRSYQKSEWKEISEDEDIPQTTKDEFYAELDDVALHLDYIGGEAYCIPTDDDDADIDFEALSDALLAVFRKMYDGKAIHFLMHHKRPWLYQKNNYSKVVVATDYLKGVGVNKSYIGGIVADGKDVYHMLYATFWMGRCNAAMPYIYFAPEGSATAFQICKYGSLHLVHYDAKEAELLRVLFHEEGFEVLNGHCGSGAITGRQTI